MKETINILCEATSFASLSADILLLGKSLRFRAHGSSMQPLVRDGDILLVRPVEASLLRVGDVILCSTQPDHILVHRVVRKFSERDGFSFLVQGDHVAYPDGLIPQAQVYGRVTRIERGGTRLFMRHPVMRLLGWLAVLRSRWQPDRGGWSHTASLLMKRFAIFSTYLS